MLLFIIDGYNLTKRNFPLSVSLQECRRRLVDLIRTSNIAGSSEFVVVFDAQKYQGASYMPENYPHIKIHFATDEEADAYIKRFVKNCKHPNRVVVVSDDNSIRKL